MNSKNKPENADINFIDAREVLLSLKENCIIKTDHYLMPEGWGWRIYEDHMVFRGDGSS